MSSALQTVSSSAAPLFHDAFYKFVRVADIEGTVQALRAHTGQLLGSIIVASEGINGMLSGTGAALDAFRARLEHQPGLMELFSGIVFKRTPCVTPPFGRMKVYSRAEIVPLGVDGVDATCHTGILLSPAEWRELIAQDDVVLIDNRNSFEYRLGHFKGAIDPQVNNFRDFPRYVEAHVAEWKAENKRVAMYCTGGIRCEKTSAWLAQYELPVYELSGGILRYFLETPAVGDEWQGECFLFDNRVAIDPQLRETGTTLDQVYSSEPDEAWRLLRAQRLAEAVAKGSDEER